MRLVHVAAAQPELAGYDSEDFEANTPDKRASALRDEHSRLSDLTAELAAGGVSTEEPVLVMGHTADELAPPGRRVRRRDDRGGLPRSRRPAPPARRQRHRGPAAPLDDPGGGRARRVRVT